MDFDKSGAHVSLLMGLKLGVAFNKSGANVSLLMGLRLGVAFNKSGAHISLLMGLDYVWILTIMEPIIPC